MIFPEGNYFKLYIWCLFFINLFYLGFGILNYIFLGDNIKPIILDNVNKENKIINTFIILYFTFLLIGSILALYPVFRTFESSHYYKLIASKNVI